MNEVYGISPEIGLSARELGLLLGLFGFRHGRFLAKFPGFWVRALLDSLNNVPDVERKRFTTLLKSREASFLSLGEPYDGTLTWLDNAVKLLDRNAVNGLITGGELQREHVYSVDDFAEANVPDSAGARALATSDNLLKFMQPVILTGSEIVLVDPYLCMASQRYQKFLGNLAVATISAGKTYRIFSSEKHFAVKESPRSQSSRCFGNGFAHRCEFFFYALDSSVDMHGRYAFNVHGGVKYDKGFGVEPSVTVDIEAMSDTTHSQYFALYARLIKATPSVWYASSDADA